MVIRGIMESIDSDSLGVAQASARLAEVLEALGRVIVGQDEMLVRLVVALAARGHVLIEGVPGLAKTRAVKALAHLVGLPFRRIQFTPDLLPADLLGTQIYRPITGDFVVRPGPIVSHVVLADEINRAPAKVQSALLEAMQEGRVTLGGEPIDLPCPFWVLATQNPLDQEGTHPLPEAQLDRFLMRLRIGYPDRQAERALLDLDSARDDRRLEELPAVLDAATLRRIQAIAASVHVADVVKDYLVDLVRATRDPRGPTGFERGASPRATLDLMRAAQAHALVRGRDFVTPLDVARLLPDVLNHRVALGWEDRDDPHALDHRFDALLRAVAVP